MTQPAHLSPEHLVPPGQRRAAWVIVGLCAVTTGIIGALVAHGHMPAAVDNAAWNALPYPWGPAGQSGNGARLLHYLDLIRQLGGPLPITFLTALLCCSCIAMRRYRAALLLAAAEIVASALTEFALKPLVGRTLGGSLSYPSGHTTAAFALAVAAVLLLASSPDTRLPRSVRTVLSVVTLGMATLVAFGMVAWHQHYLTDVIGGIAVGTGVTLSAALLLDYAAGRRGQSAALAPIPAAEPAALP